MHTRRNLLWLVCGALFVSACLHGSSNHITEVSYSRRSNYVAKEPTPSTERDAANLLGVALLDSVVLPQQAREIRFSSRYGMIANEPTPVLRVVEREGRVEGELWFVNGERFPYKEKAVRARCEMRRESASLCGTVVKVRELNWKIVADSLRLLGAWTMVGTCGLARTMDAGELNIVRLDGDVLSRYSCNTPSNKGGTEAGRAAKALYEYFNRLVRRLERSER